MKQKLSIEFPEDNKLEIQYANDHGAMILTVTRAGNLHVPCNMGTSIRAFIEQFVQNQGIGGVTAAPPICEEQAADPIEI